MTLSTFEALLSLQPRPDGKSKSVLSGTRFLSAFSNPQDRTLLQSLAQHRVSFPSGRDIVHPREPSDHLSILERGWACRYRTTRDGKRQIVALALPGEAIDLHPLFHGQAHFAATSLGTVTAVQLPTTPLLRLMGERTSIGTTLTRIALSGTAVANSWAFRLGRLDAREKIAHFLCEISDRLAPPVRGNEVSFGLPMTQELIADILGLTSVHTNRTLQVLRRDGLVATHGRTVTLPDLPALKSIGQYESTSVDDDRLGHRR